MRREDIAELHCITPTCNIPSILKVGLLSHERAKAIRHASIAMEEIQDRRTGKVVPGDYAWFRPVMAGISFLDRELIFARDWRHPDQREFWRRRSAKCAEVLVPDKVDPAYIAGIYVSCQATGDKLREIAGELPITVDADLFFFDQEGR